MSLAKLLPLLLLPLAACAGESFDAAGSAGGKADGFGAPTMVVVRNLTVCFTDPCPVFTVLDSLGSVYQIADVELPEYQIDEWDGLFDAGLEVEGVVVVGDWAPGQPGDVLHVNNVVKRIGRAAPVFNGVTCFVAPCPSYTVVHDDGTNQAVAGVDLSALDLSEESATRLFNDFSDGRVLVGGFVREGSWTIGDSGDIFVVTSFAILNDDYDMQFSDIVCITFPCPAYSGVDSAGGQHLFDEINFDAVAPSPKEMSEIIEKLASSSIRLRGFASDVTVNGFHGQTTLYTFHVTRIVSNAATE